MHCLRNPYETFGEYLPAPTDDLDFGGQGHSKLLRLSKAAKSVLGFWRLSFCSWFSCSHLLQMGLSHWIENFWRMTLLSPWRWYEELKSTDSCKNHLRTTSSFLDPQLIGERRDAVHFLPAVWCWCPECGKTKRVVCLVDGCRPLTRADDTGADAGMDSATRVGWAQSADDRRRNRNTAAEWLQGEPSVNDSTVPWVWRYSRTLWQWLRVATWNSLVFRVLLTHSAMLHSIITHMECGLSAHLCHRSWGCMFFFISVLLCIRLS